MVVIGQYGVILSLWGTYIYILGSSRYVNVCLFLRKMQKLYISGRSRYVIIHVYKFKASMQLLNYLPTETESCLPLRNRRLPHVYTFQCLLFSVIFHPQGSAIGPSNPRGPEPLWRKDFHHSEAPHRSSHEELKRRGRCPQFKSDPAVLSMIHFVQGFNSSWWLNQLVKLDRFPKEG